MHRAINVVVPAIATPGDREYAEKINKKALSLTNDASFKVHYVLILVAGSNFDAVQ